jgi:polar amino acid transport system substrate-binding protein
MKRTRTVVATGLGLVLTLGLVGCSGGTESGSGADLLADVKKNKVITIGTSNDQPWSAVENGEAVGIIPDLIREYFKRKDVDATIESTPMPFDSLIPAMKSGRIELMGDAMYITPEREKEVAFTDVLFYNAEGLAVAKGNPLGINGFSDLCGHTGATYKGTVWVKDLEKASAECPDGSSINVKVYATIYEAFQDIQTGRVQGVLADSSIAALAIKQNPDLGMELAGGYQPADKTASSNGLAVMPTHRAFAQDFSKVYEEMKADGTVASIFKKAGLDQVDTWLEA